MSVNVSNFEETDFSVFDVSLVQREVGGGKTEKEEIDRLADYPEAKSLIISGLEQTAFEYLITRFGHQFEAISFWKNKFICDLSPLGDLNDLKYLHFFVNQRAAKLWNMERNEKLTGLAIYNFTRLHSIEEVITAPHLEYFSIGNKVWSRMELESLKPLIRSQVSHFGWWGEKILDNDYQCLADSRIKELDMSISRFHLEELARLVASFPDLKGEITKPYREFSITGHDQTTTYYCLCKGKRRLIKGKDDDKFEKYMAEFNGLLEKYRSASSSQ